MTNSIDLKSLEIRRENNSMTKVKERQNFNDKHTSNVLLHYNKN